MILGQLKKFHTLTLSLLLKGFVSHTLKNRTNVKVDYAKFNVTADELDSQILHNVLVENEIIPS
jgi:hypothetical protein